MDAIAQALHDVIAHRFTGLLETAEGDILGRMENIAEKMDFVRIGVVSKSNVESFS